MKLENLPDGSHHKVIWKRSRDSSRYKASQQPNSETWWRRTTATLLGVSFGTNMREILMGRRGCVLRRHWDEQRDVVATLLRRLVAGWVVSRKTFFFDLNFKNDKL